jgi:hypothetical protein
MPYDKDGEGLVVAVAHDEQSVSTPKEAVNYERKKDIQSTYPG